MGFACGFTLVALPIARNRKRNSYPCFFQFSFINASPFV
jgi:hypothetical protein